MGNGEEGEERSKTEQRDKRETETETGRAKGVQSKTLEESRR